jgi:hypothetical protein
MNLTSKELRRLQGERIESHSDEIGKLEVDLSLQTLVVSLLVNLGGVLELSNKIP